MITIDYKRGAWCKNKQKSGYVISERSLNWNADRYLLRDLTLSMNEGKPDNFCMGHEIF